MGARVLLTGETKQSHEAEGQSTSTDRSQPALIDSCGGKAACAGAGPGLGAGGTEECDTLSLASSQPSVRDSLLTRVYAAPVNLSMRSPLWAPVFTLQCPV